LSDQARTAYLQEKVKKAKSNERVGVASIVIGGVFVVTAIVLHYYGTALSVTIAIGTSLLFYGLYVSVRYSREYDRTMKELQKVVIPASTCPKCGKQLPEVEFARALEALGGSQQVFVNKI
jgi:Flp pilus assembly protein TadB